MMKARRINLYHVQERRVNHMILNMDKIQFESRAEIGTIIKALEDWQEDHEKGPCGGNSPEQPDPAVQSRDLQNSPRCQPHDRRSRARRDG